jgi:hypothetical protein
MIIKLNTSLNKKTINNKMTKIMKYKESLNNFYKKHNKNKHQTTKH